MIAIANEGQAMLDTMLDAIVADEIRLSRMAFTDPEREHVGALVRRVIATEQPHWIVARFAAIPKGERPKLTH